MIVLDASALLAFLFRETGHDVVGEHIEEACISTVNMSEVAGRFVRDGIDPAPLLDKILESSIQVTPFTFTHTIYAARLLQQTSRFGLSLGDRACLGLAQERGLAVLTADTVWEQLAATDVEVLLIR